MAKWKQHVHPETFVRTDYMVGGVLERERVPLHTSRVDCELSWCTFDDLTDEGRAQIDAETKWARDHNRELTAELIRRNALGATHE